MPINSANRPRQIIVEVAGISVGPRGESAYTTWLGQGNVGTEQDFLDSLNGTDGIDGIDGINGVGIDGTDGLSAYEVWLGEGNVGTEQDFLDSLEGLPGPSIAGKPGASAYDIWIAEGNTGSEQDFLDDLEGEAGPAGPVVFSSDDGNSLSLGSDGYLYVPPIIPDSASVDFRWLYLGVGPEADPTANYCKFNNTDPALVTELYLSDMAYPNRNVSNILGILKSGDRIYLQQESSESKFINADIMGDPVDHDGYFTIPVSVFDSNEPLLINQFTSFMIYHSGGDDNVGPNIPALKNPEFTYTGSKLTRVDYEAGAFKDLQYSAEGVLDTLLYNNNGLLINKQFVYNSQGQLTSIVET